MKPEVLAMDQLVEESRARGDLDAVALIEQRRALLGSFAGWDPAALALVHEALHACRPLTSEQIGVLGLQRSVAVERLLDLHTAITWRVAHARRSERACADAAPALAAAPGPSFGSGTREDRRKRRAAERQRRQRRRRGGR